jgi:hypothetical protein
MTEINKTQFCEEREFDFLMIAAGSDRRAYEILRKCKQHEISIKKLIVFDFNERRKGLEKKAIKEYKEFESFGYDFSLIDCSIMDPASCLRSQEISALGISSTNTVALDISCFTKPYFFSILKYLKEKAEIGKMNIFYTEPISYVFSKGIYTHYHSTKGFLHYMEIPGYPGLSRGGTRKKILLILLGFDGELSAGLDEDISPNETIAINGFPAYSPIFKDISLMNNEQLLLNIPRHQNLKYVPANNPFEMFNFLEAFKNNYPESFLNIAPLGPKPMALGACLYALSDASTRILYPFPQKYENKISDRCANSWSYSIPLK